MAKLTKAQIDRATFDAPDGKQCILWDRVVPGRGIRVYPSGVKSVVLSCRVNGRAHIGTLGIHGVEMTLDQARIEPGEWRAKARKGIDPLEKRKTSNARGKSL